MRSTMFDSIFIPGGSHIETPRKQGRVVHLVREAFGHLKAIGATGEAVNGAKDFIGAYNFAISQHWNFDREMDGLSSMVVY